MQSDINQPILSTTSSYNIEQLSNIRPRLCTLHKWSQFDGYGIHLSCNEHWRGLHIEDIEPNSPAETAGLLREDIILAVNGRSIENEDFFAIISFIEHELEQDQICFLVLDPYSAELAQHYQLNIDENNENCIRTETFQFIESSNNIKNFDQTIAQNSSHKNLIDTYKLSSNSNLHKSEPRICSITLQPGDGSIGISLQSDTDFSHIITQVQPNSPADRAGIEPNDCIISLNNTLLLQIPFEDVLYNLAKIRNETKLDFVVGKKSYLLKLSSNKNDQIYSLSSNSTERNRSSTLPDIQTLEQLDRTQQQIIADEQYDRLSLQIYSNLHVPKHKKRHGKILDGIGPATALRFSWSITSEKTVAYSSVRSDLYARRPVTEEAKERRTTMKDIMHFFQVGMTNPSPKLQTRRIRSDLPNNSFSDDGQQHTAQSPLSFGRLNHSSKVLPSPNVAMKNHHVVHTPSPLLKNNKTIQHIVNAVPITPTLPIRKKDKRQISQSNLYLEMSVSTESGENITCSTVLDTAAADDSISASLEKSVEEETNDSIRNEPEDNKNEELFFDLPVSNTLTPKETSDDEENKLNYTIEQNEKQSSTSTSSDSNIQSESFVLNQQEENESFVDTFYIPDDTETEKYHSNTSQKHVENENDQIESSDNQQVANIFDQFSQEEQNTIETIPIPSADMTFATIPISELPNHGYELHNIKLIKSTETIPIDFKLTKQTDPFQYIMTTIAEQSKADLAGLKVDDWLIKIEDHDIRLTDFQTVLQDIDQLFNTAGFINLFIARKKSLNETNILSSVGLSNPNSPTPKEYPILHSTDSNLDKIRHITLKEAKGLYFNSFLSNNNNQNYVHYINNLQPISLAYRSGLRNNDRILTINDIDVTNLSKEELQLLILKTKPIELTVIKDSKCLESIENYKQTEIQKTLSSTIYETIDHRISKDLNNILFIDEQGPVSIKHCIVKKEASYNSLGFILIYENNAHIINHVEINLPGYDSGLRDQDIILFVNKKKY